MCLAIYSGQFKRDVKLAEKRGKQPKLSDKQQKELCRMYKTGQYSISDLAE